MRVTPGENLYKKSGDPETSDYNAQEAVFKWWNERFDYHYEAPPGYDQSTWGPEAANKWAKVSLKANRCREETGINMGGDIIHAFKEGQKG